MCFLILCSMGVCDSLFWFMWYCRLWGMFRCVLWGIWFGLVVVVVLGFLGLGRGVVFGVSSGMEIKLSLIGVEGGFLKVLLLMVVIEM